MSTIFYGVYANILFKRETQSKEYQYAVIGKGPKNGNIDPETWSALNWAGRLDLAQKKEKEHRGYWNVLKIIPVYKVTRTQIKKLEEVLKKAQDGQDLTDEEASLVDGLDPIREAQVKLEEQLEAEAVQDLEQLADQEVKEEMEAARATAAAKFVEYEMNEEGQEPAQEVKPQTEEEAQEAQGVHYNSISGYNWLGGITVTKICDMLADNEPYNRGDLQEIISSLVKAARLNGFQIPGEDPLAAEAVQDLRAQITEGEATLALLRGQIEEVQDDLATALDKEKTALTSVRAQIEEAQAKLARLQKSIKEAEADSADLWAQIPEAEATLARLQVKVEEARDDLETVQGQVQEAEEQRDKLETKITKAEGKLQAVNLEIKDREAKLASLERQAGTCQPLDQEEPEAAQAGKLKPLNVLPPSLICKRCGKPLTGPESIGRGYGDKCWRKVWKFVRGVEDPEPPASVKGPLGTFVHKTAQGDGPSVITDRAKAEATRTEILKRIKASGEKCLCGKQASAGDLRSYDHEGGYRAPGFLNPQWFYMECSKCGYQLSLRKMRSVDIEDIETEGRAEAAERLALEEAQLAQAALDYHTKSQSQAPEAARRTMAEAGMYKAREDRAKEKQAAKAAPVHFIKNGQGKPGGVLETIRQELQALQDADQEKVQAAQEKAQKAVDLLDKALGKADQILAAGKPQDGLANPEAILEARLEADKRTKDKVKESKAARKPSRKPRKGSRDWQQDALKRAGEAYRKDHERPAMDPGEG